MFATSSLSICDIVLLVPNVKYVALFSMSLYNAPSSANEVTLLNLPVGSSISMYLLCPACVLFVAFNFKMFTL